VLVGGEPDQLQVWLWSEDGLQAGADRRTVV
jgi:hypothetical protein